MKQREGKIELFSYGRDKLNDIQPHQGNSIPFDHYTSRARNESNPIYPVDINKATQIIDFKVTTFIKGPMIANSCVEVHTSNGTTGTLTHLAIGTDTAKFAEDLKKILDEENIPTILVGGDVSSPRSVVLMTGLVRNLKKQGFCLIKENNDLGEVLMGRRSKLFKNHVEVEKGKSLLREPGEKVNLPFPVRPSNE
ncbi:hypothetical protein KKD37_00370 [Patescibacteria group bacterium]|nr:hypothetical protein [Patescibacteria group bacterium]